MRVFKLELKGQGGRFLSGRCSRAFADYWAGSEPIDLVQHIFKTNVRPEYGDVNSPPITESGVTSIYDCNELEDFLCVKETNGYRVSEIAIHSDFKMSQADLTVEGIRKIQQTAHSEDPDVKEYWFDGRFRNERNIMFSGRKDQHDSTIAMFNWQTGNFGTTYVITNSDFDPNLVKPGVVKTDMDELVTDIWYDGVRLPFLVEPDAKYHDNGLYISVGYSNLTDDYQSEFNL